MPFRWSGGGAAPPRNAARPARELGTAINRPSRRRQAPRGYSKCNASVSHNRWQLPLLDHGALQIWPVPGKGPLPADSGWQDEDNVAVAGRLQYDSRPVANRGTEGGARRAGIAGKLLERLQRLAAP